MLDTSSNWRWRVQCRGLSCLDASSCSSTPGLCCPRYSLSNASLGAVFLMCVSIVASSWTAALMFPVHPPVAHRCWASGCCSRGGPLMYCLELFCLYIWDQQGTRLAQWRFLLFFPCRWLLQNISLFFFVFFNLFVTSSRFVFAGRIPRLLRLSSISGMFPSESQTTSVPTTLSRLHTAHLLSLNLSISIYIHIYHPSSEYLLQEMVANLQMNKNLLKYLMQIAHLIMNTSV